MKHQTAIHAALCTALALLGTHPAVAASTDLYLKLPTVPGMSTADTRKDWHEIDSVHWGIGVAISGTGGGGTSREASNPSVSEVAWSQMLDQSFPKLLGASLLSAGKSAQPGARFEWMSSANAKISKPYLSLLLGEASYVTGVSISNDSVSASIGSDRYTWTYDPAGLGGSSGKPTSVEIDLRLGKVSGTSARAPTKFVGDEAAATSADTRIYMHVGTGSAAIAGDSRKQGYENWIELDSVQMGVGRSYSVGGGGGGVLLSTPSVSELTFSQMLDGSFTPMVGALGKKTFDQVVIEYVRDVSVSDGAGPVTYMQIKLEDVLISSMSLSGADESPSVSGSLNFAKMTQTVWAVDAHGQRGKDSTSFGYDVLKNESFPGHAAIGDDGAFGAGNLRGEPFALASSVALPGVAPAIPEPQTWVMMLAGLGLLFGAARRR